MRAKSARTVIVNDTTSWVGSPFGVLLLAHLALACGAPGEAAIADELAVSAQAVGAEKRRPKPPPPVRPAIGVALEVEDGEGAPLRIRAGQSFYVNQIDLRASVTASRDEGIKGLRRAGDFVALGWGGVKMVEEEFEMLPGPEGFKRRRFYRDAAWMDVPSFFTVEPVDSRGNLTDTPILLEAGSNKKRRDSDDFFVRRMRAIQWTYDCASPTDCSQASNFLEEALVELRNARTPGKAKTLTLSPKTTALRLRWSLRPFVPFVIPVEQVAQPAYDYGFSIDVTALTPPRPNGTYAPGTAIQFQLTLRDGAGTRLHAPGSLPTYNDVAFGPNEAGIQYYRAFFDSTATYYRRKHRERMLMTQIVGPAQRIQPIRSIVELDQFLGPDDIQTVGTRERDGLFSQVRTFPPANQLFGGAFDPTHEAWGAPVSDTWTYRIPNNAEAGTYLVTVKGRRVYLGEDVPFTRTIEIQVGTPHRTEAALSTGPCNTCHSEGGELSQVLHGNEDRATCSGCHAPLGFELEGPVFVRAHFIHSRSDRFGGELTRCSTCHLTKQSIQRTSKAACLSCHKGYTSRHETQFGAPQSMYVGGDRESFQQCTSSCHTNHPQSGL